MLSTLVRQTGGLISAQAHEAWLWNGYRIRLVDGTTVTLPDTAANQATYPQQSGQKPGLGFPDLPDSRGDVSGYQRGAKCRHGTL